MRRACALLLAAVLAGCATVVPPPAVDEGRIPTHTEAVAAYACVLDRHVNERGEVDFAALAQAPADLERYVAFIAATAAEKFAPGPERLAHYINSYNALSMYNVIASGIPASHAGFNKVRFFVLRKFQIGGVWQSLYGYENDVIRPLGEPRIHFALNCSARSCPRLPRVPFSGDDLDAQLERETRAFFASPENFRIDHAQRTVTLSSILDFYPGDFVPKHAPNLLAYGARYAPTPPPADYRVRFAPYDWTIANRRSTPR
jgi:hypothetical protein